MAYFNHAFCKSFLADSYDTAGGTATSALPSKEVAIVGESNWESIATAALATTTEKHLVLCQGSIRTSDNIGNNPGHGGYAESVKGKAINSKYISRLAKSTCNAAAQPAASIAVGPTCAPCGENLFLRMDVKGSPALRFLNHNAYAIGDSSGDAAANGGDLTGACCVEGQEFLDPAVALAAAMQMLLADPIVAPFVAAGASEIVQAGGTNAGTWTIDEVVNGTGGFTAVTDPVADGITSVTANVVGAYVDTKFGSCSFDTRDYYGKEPVTVILSVLDESGNPCNDCGVATSTPGQMPETLGEKVLRDLILTDRYMQSPFNQGSADSARIREIEGSEEVIRAVDRDVLYQVYYIQHSVPRFNNPSGTFDNDQYLYQIFVKCTDTAVITELDNMMAALSTLSGVTFDTLQ
jgi:hypothetical protein